MKYVLNITVKILVLIPKMIIETRYVSNENFSIIQHLLIADLFSDTMQSTELIFSSI